MSLKRVRKTQVRKTRTLFLLVSIILILKAVSSNEIQKEDANEEENRKEEQ